MVRLGYACINTCLPSPNKSCTLKTLRLSKDPYELLKEKSFQNLKYMLEILKWNKQHNIMFYRCSSSMFPHISNPQIIPIIGQEAFDDYNSLTPFLSVLKTIKEFAKKMRLTMHPGQFVQLSSQKEHVVKNSLLDLAWHARFLDLVGNCESTICIHGGGTFGDKKTTLQRLTCELNKLPIFIKSKICLENCENSWSAEELLPVCNAVGIPLIFDFHHYNCYKGKQSPIVDILPKILETWKGRRPKFHLSDQDPNKRLGAHHDYVQKIPIELIRLKRGFDIMIEAKAKEKAMMYLYKKYFTSS
jgi:UV DNA damage endonuclease